jgi:HAD superfamily phosphoserine phosphatase-like hydrolase
VANLICLDFDQTAVVEDITRALFERFAPPGWRELEATHLTGRLSVEQYHQAALGLVEATQAELQAFAVSFATPREGLAELVGWAAWNGWQVVVLSTGFDICVGPVLDRLGLDRVLRHAGRASREYRWRVRYLSPRGIEVLSGFRQAYLESFREAGDAVIRVEAASQAPQVAAACAVFTDARHPPQGWDDSQRLFSYGDLTDVVSVLDREAGAWLVSCSSTTAAAD